MGQNGLWERSAGARQRIMWLMLAVAIVAALRERAFARNSARFGAGTS